MDIKNVITLRLPNKNQKHFVVCLILKIISKFSLIGSVLKKLLTILSVEADLSLVFLLALQGFVNLLDHSFTSLSSIEEAAGASFLHHLGPNKARQLTKPIRAVHDGVAMATLSIS